MMLNQLAWLRRLPAGITLLLAMMPALAADTAVLDRAEKCTGETRRLERLACFDRVFSTPLAEAEDQIRETLRPQSWRQAYRQEDDRRPGEGPMYSDTGALSGHLITVPALGARPPRPLLAIQCHNNITELSLLLPSALDRERIGIDFAGSAGSGQDLWRVRDDGFVASAGRGLPSIRQARHLAALNDTRLSSDDGRLDGLMFDLAGLSETLKPLRKACGW